MSKFKFAFFILVVILFSSCAQKTTNNNNEHDVASGAEVKTIYNAGESAINENVSTTINNNNNESNVINIDSPYAKLELPGKWRLVSLDGESFKSDTNLYVYFDFIKYGKPLLDGIELFNYSIGDRNRIISFDDKKFGKVIFLDRDVMKIKSNNGDMFIYIKQKDSIIARGWDSSNNKSKPAINENILYKPEMIWGNWHLESVDGASIEAGSTLYRFFETGKYMHFDTTINLVNVQMSEEMDFFDYSFGSDGTVSFNGEISARLRILITRQ